MKTRIQFVLTILGSLFCLQTYAGLICTIEKNPETSASGKLTIKAVNTKLSGIEGNQIILGTKFSTVTGMFAFEQLSDYYFHEKFNCPKYNVARCQTNSVTNMLEITDDDFLNSKVEIDLRLGQVQVQEILEELYPQFLDCPIN